jgi:Tyrosine phosphatase family
MTPLRQLDITGCTNLRDVGGYSTRSGMELAWGRFFRSAELPVAREAAADSVRSSMTPKAEMGVPRTSCCSSASFVLDLGQFVRWCWLQARAATIWIDSEARSSPEEVAMSLASTESSTARRNAFYD